MAYAHEAALAVDAHLIHHFTEWGLLAVAGVAVYFILKKTNRI